MKMSNNLFISYDLYEPGQNYEAVIEKIKSFGSWAKVQKSVWYIKTNYSAQQIAKAVWGVMDSSDSLIVIDTTNNTAVWYNLSDEVSKYLKSKWP
jgi:hypothetical protein